MSNVVLHKHPSDAMGAKLAMWMFLFTEVLLFGGLFILYAVYRSIYPEDFHNAATDLNMPMGTINTLVLLTSSLTVAVSIEALKRGRRKLSLWLLFSTIAFAATFLVIKYFEWSAKIHHGIYPGSEELLSHSNGEIIFFNLYYTMTGLHGLHVVIGMGILGGCFYFIARKPKVKEVMDYYILERIRGMKLGIVPDGVRDIGEVIEIDPNLESIQITTTFQSSSGKSKEKKILDYNILEKQKIGTRLAVVNENGNKLDTMVDIDDTVERIEIDLIYQQVQEKFDPRNPIKLENSGLYWHIVDVIWIFLFPLFYLIT